MSPRPRVQPPTHFAILMELGHERLLVFVRRMSPKTWARFRKDFRREGAAVTWKVGAGEPTHQILVKLVSGASGDAFCHAAIREFVTAIQLPPGARCLSGEDIIRTYAASRPALLHLMAQIYLQNRVKAVPLRRSIQILGLCGACQIPPDDYDFVAGAVPPADAVVARQAPEGTAAIG